MTRQTFKPLAAALLFSAVVASPASHAYFAVSLPGNAMTMSGSYYAEPVTAEPAVEQPNVRSAKRKAQPAQTTPPLKLRASGTGLKAPGR